MHKILFYNTFIICLYMFRALCAHHQEVKIVLYSIWYHHTCRWPSGAQVERGLLSWILDFKHILHTLHPALEDGTDRGFRNVGKPQSDAGEIPKRIHTILSWIITVFSYVNIGRYWLQVLLCQMATLLLSLCSCIEVLALLVLRHKF